MKSCWYICGLALVTGALLVTGACSEEDVIPTIPVTVLSESGTRHALGGTTWLQCLDSPTTDDGNTWTFTGNTMSVNFSNFTSTGSACNAGPTVVWTASFDVSGGTDVLMNDWSDDTVITVGPTRLDGGGLLADPPTATYLVLHTTASSGPPAPAVGTDIGFFWFIDDTTAAGWRAYIDTNLPSPACDALPGVLAPGGCLSTMDYFVRQ